MIQTSQTIGKEVDTIERALEHFLDVLITRIPQLALALLILLLGTWFIRMFLQLVRRRFERRNVDLSLRDFIGSIIKVVLYTLLLLTTASMIGIQTTSFIAVLGAASLSIGLALQGSLSNFAGGVLILLFRPFKVGDYISSATGATGTVEKIDILYTTLRTSEGISVFAPNGPLANSIVSNYSALEIRRAEYKINVGYDTPLKKAKELLLQTLQSDPRTLDAPLPEVRLEALNDGAVQLVVRCWFSKVGYWDAYYDMFEKIKKSLEEQNFGFPANKTETRIVGLEELLKAQLPSRNEDSSTI
jgi:small conductance mechanosensitive channel